jgi:Glycosyl transferases group 1
VLLAATLVAVLPAARAPDIGEAVIQAQALGTPVIAANVGAASEIVLAPPAVTESARTGFLVAPGNAPALAVAMANVLMLGPSARSRLSARAIAHAEQHHSAARACAPKFSRSMPACAALEKSDQELPSSRWRELMLSLTEASNQPMFLVGPASAETAYRDSRAEPDSIDEQKEI